MARYSRRTGPPVDFAPPGVNTPIPGCSVTRFFDDGELLIAWTVSNLNTSGVTRDMDVNILLDGVNPTTASQNNTCVPTGRHDFGGAMIVPVTEGQHTIDLAATADTHPLFVIPAGNAVLSLIQLPLWDSDADIL